jgi:S-adenosylmethionine:tRNA ribosyltransferase-isomerase
LKTKDFDYTLPEHLIAQHPADRRDLSRLLVYDRQSGTVAHRHFRDVVEYIRPDDCLVLNDTRVIPARLLGKREDTGGAMEFLLLKDHGNDVWETLVKPGRRAQIGTRFTFGDGVLTAEVLSKTDGGGRLVRFFYEGVFAEVLDRVGLMPLPPYIHEKLEDPERYQTVYARYRGSAAAPTAGLHFTEELLDTIREQGTAIAKLTLHVGLGTFRPVKEERIEDHPMHAEAYTVTEEAADTINTARLRGGRIIAVGTTAVRTLETVADENGTVHPGEGQTDIFIYPGYRFRAVDCLITNFHLPQSTLLMLVSAFAGREQILAVYREAVAREYRFFSFGDAMLIL